MRCRFIWENDGKLIDDFYFNLGETKMRFQEFKSKFAINDLVEYEHDGILIIGKIEEINFWQSDAVNYACGYKIVRANSEQFDSVSEQFVKKVFRDL